LLKMTHQPHPVLDVGFAPSAGCEVLLQQNQPPGTQWTSENNRQEGSKRPEGARSRSFALGLWPCSWQQDLGNLSITLGLSFLCCEGTGLVTCSKVFWIAVVEF
jgi:hypothetical protein